MLTSLFGALYPRRTLPEPGTDQDFAPTMMLETPASASCEAGKGRPDAAARDLLLRDASGDQWCRQLLSGNPGSATTRPVRRITLFDPAGACASDVVKLLSDAAGEPLERLYLRRQETLSTLALVERTALPRRLAEPLQVSHLEVRSDSLRDADLSLALLGCSHLAVVMLSPMPAPVLEQLLALLHGLVHRADWHCPNLLFLGTAPSAPVQRFASMQWPAALNLEFSAEVPGSASGTWNAILRSWNRMKLLPQRTSPPLVPASRPSPSRTVPALRPAAGTSSGGGSLRSPSALPRLDRHSMSRSLEILTTVRGVLGAALADSTTGMVLSRQLAVHSGPPDLDQAAVVLSEVLKAHRRATLGSSCAQGIQEVLVTQTFALQVLRPLRLQSKLFLFAVLDRATSNLALVRHALAEAEKRLY